MSRVTDNEMTLENIVKVFSNVQVADPAIPITGILSDISRSLAVIADALAKNQEDKV